MRKSERRKRGLGRGDRELSLSLVPPFFSRCQITPTTPANASASTRPKPQDQNDGTIQNLHIGSRLGLQEQTTFTRLKSRKKRLNSQANRDYQY